jgi:Cu-Zn family superoxide dismutase
MNRNVPLLAATALLLAACSNMSLFSSPTATATLSPTKGNSTWGVVYFTQHGDSLLVSGEVHGLAPNSEHGFHIHENGDCSSGDGMSAGGHFNPEKQPHGRYDMPAHHAGDIPSLHADASGVATINFETSALRIGKAADDVLARDNIVGRGVIVHRDPDDYTTQPTGNSGPRLACGVVRRS